MHTLDLQTTTSLLGIGLAFIIFYLLRRDHIYSVHGFFWLTAAFFATLFGFWPALINRLAVLLGFSYPPALLLLAGIFICLIKILHTDVMHTKLERQIRLLNQRISILEAVTIIDNQEKTE